MRKLTTKQIKEVLKTETTVISIWDACSTVRKMIENNHNVNTTSSISRNEKLYQFLYELTEKAEDICSVKRGYRVNPFDLGTYNHKISAEKNPNQKSN